MLMSIEKYAENNVVIIPTSYTKAGPDPKAKRIIAAINVVIFPDQEYIFALEYPEKHRIMLFSVFTSYSLKN